MSWNPENGRSTKAKYYPDRREWVANWFLTSSSQADVVDIVLDQETPQCYCLEQGITTASCMGQGESINKAHYEALANRINVESEVLQAIGIVETKGNPFITTDPQRARILFERHYMYDKALEEGLSREEVAQAVSEQPDIIHPDLTPAGGYGTFRGQLKRLARAKEVDEEAAIMSCSWGRFQVMGSYYERLYDSPQGLESAQNMCEVQHFAYFVSYLENTPGIVEAMRTKNWPTVARLYNGPRYAKNSYHTKMETAYHDLKNGLEQTE